MNAWRFGPMSVEAYKGGWILVRALPEHPPIEEAPAAAQAAMADYRRRNMERFHS